LFSSQCLCLTLFSCFTCCFAPSHFVSLSPRPLCVPSSLRHSAKPLSRSLCSRSLSRRALLLRCLTPVIHTRRGGGVGGTVTGPCETHSCDRSALPSCLPDCPVCLSVCLSVYLSTRFVPALSACSNCTSCGTYLIALDMEGLFFISFQFELILLIQTAFG
jgi:hypothetical protein